MPFEPTMAEPARTRRSSRTPVAPAPTDGTRGSVEPSRCSRDASVRDRASVARSGRLRAPPHAAPASSIPDAAAVVDAVIAVAEQAAMRADLEPVLVAVEPFELLEPTVEAEPAPEAETPVPAVEPEAAEQAVPAAARAPQTDPAPEDPASVVDEFEMAARLFAFTGETPVQKQDAAPAADADERRRCGLRSGRAGPGSSQASAGDRVVLGRCDGNRGPARGRHDDSCRRTRRRRGRQRRFRRHRAAMSTCTPRTFRPT